MYAKLLRYSLAQFARLKKPTPPPAAPDLRTKKPSGPSIVRPHIQDGGFNSSLKRKDRELEKKIDGLMDDGMMEEEIIKMFNAGKEDKDHKSV